MEISYDDRGFTIRIPIRITFPGMVKDTDEWKRFQEATDKEIPVPADCGLKVYSQRQQAHALRERVLLYLRDHGKQSPGQLVVALGSTKARMSHALKRLRDNNETIATGNTGQRSYRINTATPDDMTRFNTEG